MLSRRAMLKCFFVALLSASLRVRAEAASDHKRETIPVDASVLTSFHKMVENMKTGGGVSFLFDPGDVAKACNDTLTTRTDTGDDIDGDVDDNNNRDEEEEWTREIYVI